MLIIFKILLKIKKYSNGEFYDCDEDCLNDSD